MAKDGNVIWVIFDGGTRKSNPGPGYGSFEIVGVAPLILPTCKEYGTIMTSNEAEYQTLVQALDALYHLVAQSKVSLDSHLVIVGDSQVVINHLNRTWQAKSSRLRLWRDRVWKLTRPFNQVSYQWQPRAKSVTIFGH